MLSITKNEYNYVLKVKSLYKDDDAKKLNRVSLQKLALTFNITHKRAIKELSEFAIVLLAKELAKQKKPIKAIYNDIVALYEKQANSSFRDSNSIIYQQYSTPAPISYLAGIYCNIQNPKTTFFEPSAGNGLLTLAGNDQNGYVNEIDVLRNTILNTQHYKFVGNQDATIDFNSDKYANIFTKIKFDAILSNPPFGGMKGNVTINGYPVQALEHFMIFNALKQLKPTGKAAFIIGGHSTYDADGRLQRGKNSYFLHNLYNHYNVEDVINLDGHKLYSRQGTSFDVRMILINGIKKVPAGFAPLFNKANTMVINSFDGLYKKVMSHLSDDREKALKMALQLEKDLKNLK